jgi:ferredoxin-type protein NapF
VRPEKAFRPPWAVAEAHFLECCTRCDECIRICPTGLLFAGGGGYPEADFRPGKVAEGCTFCGECLKVCQPAALHQQTGQAPWTYRASIGQACLARQGVVCRTCGEFCELGAIRFKPQLGGVSLPQLQLEACSGCAACLADCPTQAIYMNFFAQQGAA